MDRSGCDSIVGAGVAQEEFEAAIVALTSALASDVGEDAYQALFEQHPVILDVMGYARVVPHPNLPLSAGKAYVPDFMCERLDSGLADVLDLKLPTTRVLLGRERREAFSAAMNSYIGQMFDYQDYFDEQAHREAVRERYGLTVPRRPNALLIAGRSADLDRAELYRQLNHSPGINLVTFDDVLRAVEVERGRHYGRWEGVGGLAFHTVVRFRRGHEHRDRYLFEAQGEDGFRFGACIAHHSQLVLRAHSPAGAEVEVAATTVDYDRWTAVSCLIGAKGDSTLLQLEVEGRIVAEQRLEQFDPGSRLFEHMTLGADRAGERGGVVDVAEHMVYDRLPTFQERLQIAEYLRDEVASVGPYVEFSGSQWLATDGGRSEHGGANDGAAADDPR